MPQMPPTLFVVRVRGEPFASTGRPVKSEKPLGLEGTFATREQAEAFQTERERCAGQSGDAGPLLAIHSLAQLRELSAFEPCVLRDWMTDHDIPDPETFVNPRPTQETDRTLDWLRKAQKDDRYLDWLLCLSKQQRADLYAALHHFHFYEIVEVPFIFGDYPEENWEQWEAQTLTRPFPHSLRQGVEDRQEPDRLGTSRKVYVIVCREFTYCGNWTEHSDDSLLKAFSDREQARAYLDRCWRHLGDEEGVVYQIVEMELPA